MLIILTISIPKTIQVINNNKEIILFDNKYSNITDLNWEYNDKFPATRKCDDSELHSYDKMGWGNNCSINNFLNIYLSSDNLKKSYSIDIKGKNIPNSLLVRVNGKLYRDFNVYDDKIILGNQITYNHNLFLYIPNSSDNFYIYEISLK